MLDNSKLTVDQQAMLETHRQREKQISELKDIATIAQDISKSIYENNSKEDIKKLGALLVDVRESIKSLNDKEAPETPDFAKPVVDAVSKLEKALTASMKAIDVKPQVNVSAPSVNVDAPNVDLSKVEKILKSDIPKAFNDAIKKIPKTEIPKADYTPLLDMWRNISAQLESIDTASRLKPQFPTQLKVVAPDGNNLIGLRDGIDYDYLDVQQTSAAVETFVYKLGGSSGTTVRTIVLTYTDSSKADIDSVAWS